MGARLCYTVGMTDTILLFLFHYCVPVLALLSALCILILAVDALLHASGRVLFSDEESSREQ